MDTNDTAFNDSLVGAALQLFPDGYRSIVIWGVTQTCLQFLERIALLGLTGRIAGIVDPRLELVGTSIAGLKIQRPEEAVSMRPDAIILTRDFEKEEDLRCIAALGLSPVRIVLAGTQHLAFCDPLFEQIRASLLVSSRAAGYPMMLVHLYQCLAHIARAGLKGDIAEFGVYKGGTTMFLARAARELGLTATVYGFDTFSGFPPRTSPLDLYDSAHDQYTTLASVRAHCSTERILLVQGDIAKTHVSLQGVPLVLSFFDTDNYSGTRAALQTAYEHTVPGGFLAFDHYHCDERWVYTVGERIAVKEFMVGKSFFHLHGTGIFMKV